MSLIIGFIIGYLIRPFIQEKVNTFIRNLIDTNKNK